MSTPMEQAQLILSANPLPDNARALMEALEPKFEDFIFEDLMEALSVAEMEQGQFTA